MIKKIKEEIVETTSAELPKAHIKTEKEKLLELYQTLKDLNINSIGDLEVRISRAE